MYPSGSTLWWLTLQVSWFVDYFPGWLGPVLMTVGFYGLMVLPAYQNDRNLGVAIAPLVFAGPAYLVVRENVFVFVVIILFFARMVEGAAVIRFYWKCVGIFSDRANRRHNWTDDGVVFLGLLGLFTLLLGVWLVIAVLTFTTLGAVVALTVAWTLLSLLLSLIGMSLKVWTVRDALKPVVLVSFVFLISGAEIVNFKFLYQEVLAFLIGNFGYSFGYWLAVGRKFFDVELRIEEIDSRGLRPYWFRISD